MPPLLTIKFPGLLDYATRGISPLEQEVQPIVGINGSGNHRPITAAGFLVAFNQQLNGLCLTPDGIDIGSYVRVTYNCGDYFIRDGSISFWFLPNA